MSRGPFGRNAKLLSATGINCARAKQEKKAATKAKAKNARKEGSEETEEDRKLALIISFNKLAEKNKQKTKAELERI